MANLPIRLQPGATADRIEGWEADAEGRRVLKVRVRARPMDGEANDALIRLLAKSLGVSKSSVTVTRGGQSRSKMILVGGLDDEMLSARIAESFAATESDPFRRLARSPSKPENRPMTTDARILHARSGVVFEQRGEDYAVSSLRLSEPLLFTDMSEAQLAFDSEVKACEQDPELMSRLGGA